MLKHIFETIADDSNNNDINNNDINSDINDNDVQQQWQIEVDSDNKSTTMAMTTEMAWQQQEGHNNLVVKRGSFNLSRLLKPATPSLPPPPTSPPPKKKKERKFNVVTPWEDECNFSVDCCIAALVVEGLPTSCWECWGELFGRHEAPPGVAGTWDPRTPSTSTWTASTVAFDGSTRNSPSWRFKRNNFKQVIWLYVL